MFKSEAASWFRIYEMFQFDSFHMYGIMGSALVLGAVLLQIIKGSGTKSFFGETIVIAEKKKSLGAGFWPIAIVFFGSILGALCYGALRSKLPH